MEDAYNSLPKHRWVKIQDENGKSLFGPFEELGEQLDFSLIRYLQIQDEIFGELSAYFDKCHLDSQFAKLGARLRDNLILTNCSFAQFIIKLFLQETGEVPEIIKTLGNPDGITLYHTTRMKIYLYDTKRVPYVVKVDMPHKGDGNENKLHFNVETLCGESPLNHEAIDCSNTNPIDLLNVMVDNMRRMTPRILNIKDSYKEDDTRMLELMIAFNAYDDLCTAYFLK